MSNQNSNVQFKRMTYAKGFTNHKGLDEFIQSSLDKYYFVDPRDEMYEATGEYSKYIVSNKSAIPDLVIWNKKFNKNECFFGADAKEYNSFPRFKFILRAKPPNNQGKANFNKTREKEKGKVMNEKKESANAISNKNNILKEEDLDNEKEVEIVKYDPYDEDVEPQWVDVDVKEFEYIKLEFKGLPDTEKNKNPTIDENSEKLNLSLKEKYLEHKEDFSLHDESHDDHLDKIIKLNLTSEDEKTNDNIIIKDEKEIPSLNTENLFNLNSDIFIGKKPNDNFQTLLTKENGKELIKLEKNSLFEKDFTFIFKSSDENRDKESKQISNMKANSNNEEISSNLQNTINKENKQTFFQIEQSTNILFENNMFEKDKIKKETYCELEELKNLQKNLMPNISNPFNDYDQEEEDEEEIKNSINFKAISQNPNIIKENKNLMNQNLLKQFNMNMRLGMPFNLTQNPNLIPIPIHPMNMINSFGNFEEINPNENMLKNHFVKNTQINQTSQNSGINHVYLENPNSIVHKNMYHKGWLLMTLNDKILGQFTSIDLFKYLDKKITEGWNFEHTWITDYETDIYFTPSNLYEILKEIIPNVLLNAMNKNKNPQMNFPINPGMNPNLNPINPQINPLNPNFNPNMSFSPIHFNLPPPMNIRQINLNDGKLNNVTNTNNNSMRMNNPPPNMNLIPNGNPNLLRMQEREENRNVNKLSNMNNLNNINIMNQFPFNLDPRFQNIPQNIPNMKNNPNFNFPNNIGQNMQPPLNMNINLQFVKNNINLNNIMLNNNNQPNVNFTHKSSTSNSNNKPLQEKSLPGLGNKDGIKTNNNDSSIFNTNLFQDKNNNMNSGNNIRSTNQTKKKNNFIK